MKTGSIFMAIFPALALTLAINAPSRADLPAANEAIAFDFSVPFLNEVLKQSEKAKMFLKAPRCAGAPAIDGKIAPDEWTNAATIDALISTSGQKANPPALIRLMYDDNSIYIAAECSVPDARALKPIPEAPPARDSKEVWKEDHLEMWISPSAKGGRTHQFVINALGAIYDLAGEAANYDPDWTHAAGRNERGWTVEMAIPKTALQVTEWPGVLGFNIGRNGPYVSTCSWTGDYGDTSRGAIRLEGILAAKPMVDKESTGTSDALITKVVRSYARPGDRWIEVEIEIRGQRSEVRSQCPELQNLQLTAEVFPLGNVTPVAQGALTPPYNSGKVLVDLRRLNLTQARLILKLAEGQEVLGTSEMVISARDPEQALKTGEKIKVLLDVPAGVDKVELWPVIFGVPFPAGTIWNVNDLNLVDKNGTGIPCQVEESGLWAREGAVKWARFTALVSPEDECFVEIGAKEKAPPKTPLTLTEKDGRITVDTGPAVYVLGKGISPITEILLGGKRIATCPSASLRAGDKTKGLYVIDQTGRIGSASANEESMVIEARGPVASCVRFEGYYAAEKGEKLARHITRVENFAGQASAKITHTLVLCNSTTNLWFKDIGWEFAVAAGSDAKALFGISRSDPSSLEQLRRAGWQKTQTVNLNADTPSAYMLQDDHYFFAHGTNHFEVAGIDKTGKAKMVMEGEECGDWGALAGSGGTLALACRDTALQHPKEFEVSADKITLHLFSNRAGLSTGSTTLTTGSLVRPGSPQVKTGEELDFRTPTLVKKWDLVNWYKQTLPGAYVGDSEAMAERVKNNLKNDAIGWAKTHDLFIIPLPPGADAALAAKLAHLNCREVYALISPQWSYKSGVFGPLHPKDPGRFPEAERYLEATFRLWEKRLADWGDYGFMFYFTGPHLEYSGKYAKPYRYAKMATYTLRSDLWQAYVRSGDRNIREFAEKTIMVFGDSVINHWAGKGKVKGLFIEGPDRQIQPYDLVGNLPFHWEGDSYMEKGHTSNMHDFMNLYHMTGRRRAKDIVEEYAEGLKRFWTPVKAKQDWHSIEVMQMLAQAYTLNWDPALRELAEATTDIFADSEGEIGLTKERPYRSTTYKSFVDVYGLIDAWEILGNPRQRELSLKVAGHWWAWQLGAWPVSYVNNQGRMGIFLYNETGNPAYAEILALQTRQAASDFIPGTNVISGVVGAEESTFVFQGIPYSEHLMTLTGADKKLVAAWVAYEDFGYPSSIVLKKSDNGILDVDLRTEGKATELKGAGAVGGVALRPVGIGTTSGLDLNRVTQKSGGAASIHVPKDAPEGAYEILVPPGGFHIAVAHGITPMVVYAPDYWRPAPRQTPPIKWYFNVPSNSPDAQIFFESAAQLYTPDGQAWQDGKPQTNWVDIPADKPGLWAFAPSQEMPAQSSAGSAPNSVGLVQVKNIPPFFATRDPKSWFEPPIPWNKQEKYRPPEKPVAGTVYVPGAIQTPGNRALYLDGKRTFILEAGLPPVVPSVKGLGTEGGDGSQFLPFKQGTIEFFFKSSWSTFNLPANADKYLLRMNVVTGETWHISYMKNPQAQQWLGSHVLLGYFMTDGPYRRQSMRTYRQSIIPSDEWIHVAWVWGPRAMPDFTQKSGIKSMTTEIFINGKRGKQYSYGDRFFQGHSAADQPKTLELGPKSEAAYDELHVSDIQRYLEEFTPPPRDREFKVDEHTRALFHFNGNVQGESHGQPGSSVTGELKD